MESIKGELARIKTRDDLELHGILFEPNEKSTKAIIHVHGWTGNFYENVFIDFIARAALSKGFAFLSFNTRGAGHVQEFRRKKGPKAELVKIGGSLEKFEDSIIDIAAAAEFLASRGYNSLVLEGHSTGCQKVAYYKHKTQDKKIKGLILLEPTDDPSICEKFLGDRYKEAIEISRAIIKEGKEDEPMPEWLPFGVLLSAGKFLSMADPNSEEGKLFRFSGKMSEIREIDCPALAMFGADTEYQEKPGEQLEILKSTMKECDTKLIEKTNHWFAGQETELAATISKWLETRIL